jgi:hypothetical protein
MPTLTCSRVTKWSALALGAAFAVAPAFGQTQPPQPTQPPAGQPGGGQPGGTTDAARQAMVDQFRKQAEDRLKVLLECNDDEYAVLKPRIEKLQQVQSASDSRRVGYGMLMGGAANATWRNRGTTAGDGQKADPAAKPADDAAKPAAQPAGRWSPFGNQADTPAYTKAKELQAALESKEATPDTVKTRLAELRAAKQQAKQEVTRSQEELRQLCSVRQEALLVMLGILE